MHACVHACMHAYMKVLISSFGALLPAHLMMFVAACIHVCRCSLISLELFRIAALDFVFGVFVCCLLYELQCMCTFSFRAAARPSTSQGRNAAACHRVNTTEKTKQVPIHPSCYAAVTHSS